MNEKVIEISQCNATEITDEMLEQSAGVDSMGSMDSTYSNTGCRPAPCGCITN